MVVKRYKRKSGYTSNFYCSNQTNHKSCVPHIHLVSDIEAFVYDAMLSKVNEIDRFHKDGNKDTNKRILEYHKRIEDINAKIENLVLNLEQAGTSTIKYINNRIEELDAEKQKIEAELGSYKFESDSLIIPQLDNWESKPLEEKKKATRLLIDKVSITADSSIMIYWKV
jgi:chromosome segregation ATPase